METAISATMLAPDGIAVPQIKRLADNQEKAAGGCPRVAYINAGSIPVAFQLAKVCCGTPLLTAMADFHQYVQAHTAHINGMGFFISITAKMISLVML